VVGTEGLILTQHSPYLCSYHDMMGVGKPVKKPTSRQAAPGLEPGTSRVQSGALGAWPRCLVQTLV
jgi:hypothetical protein